MGKTSQQTPEQALRRQAFVRRACETVVLPVTTGSVHGVNVVAVTADDEGRLIPECDGILTDAAGVPLVVAHSDCVPIFMWSHDERVVGLLHAGWRGVLAGILPAAIQKMGDVWGIAPEDLFLHFGPSLQSCHFEIQHDVEAMFAERGYGNAVVYREDKMFGDLFAVLRAQADDTGVLAASITADSRCTFCTLNGDGQPMFGSWRRDGVAERNMISVMMKQ